MDQVNGDRILRIGIAKKIELQIPHNNKKKKLFFESEKL